MPVIRPLRRLSPRRGAAIAEFAILMPIILALLVGIWEVGRMIEVQQMLSNAAREGGRQASTGQFTNTQIQQVVTQYLQVAGLPTGNVTVTVQDLTNTSLDVSQAQYLDRIQITVTIPFQDVRWSLLSLVTSPTTTLTAQSVWITMVDKPYPIPPEPPVG
jgi:Flp pilus assembly protein TadG